MDTSGQVGIATTGPAEPLHVMSDAGHDAIQISENVGGEAWQIGVDADGDLHFEDDGSKVIIFEDGGNVGISTTAPAGLLHLSDGNLILTGSSKIGVYTKTPAAQLHVNGTAQIDNVLTLDADDIALYDNNPSFTLGSNELVTVKYWMIVLPRLRTTIFRIRMRIPKSTSARLGTPGPRQRPRSTSLRSRTRQTLMMSASWC